MNATIEEIEMLEDMFSWSFVGIDANGGLLFETI